MAGCAICSKSIIFGGKTVDGFRYCSKRCADKGLALALTPGTSHSKESKPAGPVWVVIWAVIAISAGILNLVFDLASRNQEAASSGTLAAALGFASMPFLLAGVCALWKQFRNLHSFFKVAGIIGILLVFSVIGRVSVPPSANDTTARSGAPT